MQTNPEDDITLSGEISIVVHYSFEANKSLSLSDKLNLMDEREEEIIKEIKNLNNVNKVEV